MGKCWFGVLFIVLVFAVVGCASGNAGSDPAGCVSKSEAFTLEGLRIDTHNDVMEIAVSETTWVGHGWAGVSIERTQSMSSAELCSFLRSHLLFELIVDGAHVEPDFAMVDAGGEAWILGYYYLFPAGHFAPGIHILVGTWTISGLPCYYWTGGCEPSEPQPGGVIYVLQPDGTINARASHSLTLSVSY